MAGAGAAHILVVKTCVPALIGEELEGGSDAVGRETGAAIRVIDAAHFKRNGYLSGYALAYEALAFFLPKLAAENQVNLLGGADGAEFARLKDLIGARFRRAAFPAQEPDDWPALARGRLNLVFSALFLKMARAMEERLGIAYIDLTRGTTPARVAALYRAISGALEMPVELDPGAAPARCAREPLRYTSSISHPDILTMVAILDACGAAADAIHLEEADDVSGREGLSCDPQVFYEAKSANRGATSLIFENGASIPGGAIEAAMKKIGYERIEALCALVRSATEGGAACRL